MDSYSDWLADLNQRDRFADVNHIHVTWAEDGQAEGILEITPESLNPMGIVHGGALVTLADTVAGIASYSKSGPCVTLDSTMQYLAPGTGKHITCVAKPKKVGKTIQVYDALLTDDQGRTVATGTYTYFSKK